MKTPDRATDRGLRTRQAIVDATIVLVAEHGLRATTAASIAEGAGVSQGAIFRHYPTLNHLFVATAEVVGERLISQFTEAVAPDERDLSLMIATMLRLTKSQPNMVWHELIFHARTDTALAEFVTPCIATYRAKMTETASALTVFANQPEDIRRAGVELLTSVFDGATHSAHLPTNPLTADLRERMLLAFAREMLTLK